MQVSFRQWLKEYAIAYVLALFLAFCVFFILIFGASGGHKIFQGIEVLGWQRTLEIVVWKTIVTLVSGTPVAIKMIFQSAFLGQLSSVFAIVLNIILFMLPVLHLFVEQAKKRKIFWGLWVVLCALVSLMTVGVALSVVVPV